MTSTSTHDGDQAQRLVIEQRPGVVLVRAIGEHDLSTAPELRQLLHRALDGGFAVVLELSLTAFVDSTVMGALLGALRRAREGGIGFALVVEQDSAVDRTLALAGMLRAFPAYASVDEAVRAAASGRNTAAQLTP